MNPKLVGGIVVLLLAVFAAGWLITGQQGPGVPAAGTVRYTNTDFTYVFDYPDSWVAEPETSIINEADQIPSIITVHEATSTSPHRFGVTVNRNERTIKRSATTTVEVTLDKVKATAYIFPDGLQCTPSEADPDCSFFLIPIFRDGVWYEITAANDAKTLDAYRDILESFRFTQ